MDLAARKYKFIEQLLTIATPEQLDKLEAFFNTEIITPKDPFTELPEIAKQLLAKSKKDIANGNIKSHNEVMQNIKAKYNL